MKLILSVIAATMLLALTACDYCAPPGQLAWTSYHLKPNPDAYLPPFLEQPCPPPPCQ